MKLPLLVLVGPTAVGKTAVSIELARRLGGEIISGDSMQVYRGLDIGTAKISPAEMQGVPHHLIDIKAPDEAFSVAEFQQRTDDLIREIHGRGHLPMLVGGTGLYVRSVLLPYSFSEQETDHELRERLHREEELHGPGYLHGRLAQVDPEAAAKLHPGDLRRIVRALEVFETTGVPISQTQTALQQGAERRYDDLFLGLTMERERLYQRIEQRVDQMLVMGWEAEVRRLLAAGYRPGFQSLDAIGYRELVHYLGGRLTYPECIALIKRNTRRFAKRQLTWFHRDEQIRWFDMTGSNQEEVVTEITKLAEGKWHQHEETVSP